MAYKWEDWHIKTLHLHHNNRTTSDLELVSWSHLSGFLCSCWEFGCRCTVGYILREKVNPLLHFTNSFPHSFTLMGMRTQYMTLRCLWPLFHSMFHQQLNSSSPSLITSSYFYVRCPYHLRQLKHCAETALGAVNVLHASGWNGHLRVVLSNKYDTTSISRRRTEILFSKRNMARHNQSKCGFICIVLIKWVMMPYTTRVSERNTVHQPVWSPLM